MIATLLGPLPQDACLPCSEPRKTPVDERWEFTLPGLLFLFFLGDDVEFHRVGVHYFQLRSAVGAIQLRAFLDVVFDFNHRLAFRAMSHKAPPTRTPLPHDKSLVISKDHVQREINTRGTGWCSHAARSPQSCFPALEDPTTVTFHSRWIRRTWLPVFTSNWLFPILPTPGYS